MSREVMQQALEALELIHPDLVCQTAHHKHGDRHDFTADCPVKARHQQAITALREALKRPEQEPVMWVMPDGKTVDKWALQFYGGQVGKPLYATPFQRKPLTEMGVIDLKPIGHHSLQLIFNSQASIEAFKAAHGIKEQI